MRCPPLLIFKETSLPANRAAPHHFVVNGSFELQNFHAGAYSLTLRVADAPPAIALASAVLNVNADVDGHVSIQTTNDISAASRSSGSR
jgi:hypothetical protein